MPGILEATLSRTFVSYGRHVWITRPKPQEPFDPCRWDYEHFRLSLYVRESVEIGNEDVKMISADELRLDRPVCLVLQAFHINCDSSTVLIGNDDIDLFGVTKSNCDVVT